MYLVLIVIIQLLIRLMTPYLHTMVVVMEHIIILTMETFPVEILGVLISLAILLKILQMWIGGLEI